MAWSRMALPLLAVLLVGCSGAVDRDTGSSSAGSSSAGSSAATARPSSTPEQPLVVVAVGASETVGVGADDPLTESWPQALHDASLPSSTLVNVGVSGDTVGGALTGQLPRALAADPDVVTVWLAVNDLVAGVPVETYERQLRTLVRALRGDGSADVLVGNVPDLWRLPVYRACVPGSGVTDLPCLLPAVPSEAEVRALVAAFNEAIVRVVRSEQARLVDLTGRGQLARLTAGDGFHPSTAGHREVAAAFQRVLEGSGTT